MSQLGLFADPSSQLIRAFDDLGTVSLRNRKYIGSKVKLLDFIEREILLAAGHVDSFLDGFSGTGVVADRFRSHTNRLTLVDNLDSNYSINRTFFASQEHTVRVEYVANSLRTMNRLEPVQGYAWEHYGGRYFTYDNAGIIDAVRDEIENRYKEGDCSEQEAHVLITSLLFAVDKVANTVGQYDAYLKNLGAQSYDDDGRHVVDSNVYGRLCLRMPVLRFGEQATVIKADMNSVMSGHRADVVYLDPPYSERQYVDCYHVLENISTWQKPPVHGKTQKFERSSLKSRYSRRSTALTALKELIDQVNARLIVLSYSNEGIIPIQEIEATLAARGPTTVVSHNYAVFGNGAGQSVRRAVVEYLAICRVSQ